MEILFILEGSYKSNIPIHRNLQFWETENNSYGFTLAVQDGGVERRYLDETRKVDVLFATISALLSIAYSIFLFSNS